MGTSTLPEIRPKLDALRNLYEGKKIIVGRDKLDVVKGVIQKVVNRLMLFFSSPCVHVTVAARL